MKVLICTFGCTCHCACRLFYALLKDTCDVKLFFFNGKWDKNTESFIRKYVREEAPDLVAVSLLTFELELCKKLSAAVRSLCSPDKTKIIFGGPYTFLMPETCFETADFVCTGEGEYTLLGLRDRFEETRRWEGAELESVPNLSYRQGGAVRKSGVQDFYYSRPFMDTMPFPAYGEAGIHVYDGINWKGDTEVQKEFYYAFASRGCPNRCAYCINSLYATRKVTLRSPEKVVEEIGLVKKKFPNLKGIRFIDEIFCTQTKWAADFTRLYKEKVALPFECSSFPGRHSEEVIGKLAEAGLAKVNIGVQSCSKRILEEVFVRPQKIEDIIIDNKRYIKHGVIPTYDFIIDNPFETADELLETVEVARRLERPNFFRIFSLFFFPYHPLTLRAQREGLCREAGAQARFYDKVTTTHTGDQCCRREWYTKPFRVISKGDKKAALNWILVFYGDARVPKFVADFTLAGYKRRRYAAIVVMAYYYRFIDLFYWMTEKWNLTTEAYRRHGIVKTAKHILKKICSGKLRLINRDQKESQGLGV